MMNYRKTRIEERGTYTYEFTNGNKVELIPGENGITELDIKKLHSIDDSEVYNNSKNLRPNRTAEEKEKIKEEKKLFIEKFKLEYGYEPEKSLIDDHINNVFPRNYNISLDAELVNQDKSSIENKIIRQEEFEWSDKMIMALETLTQKERIVIIDYFENGLKKKEIAEKLGISNAAVTKHYNKALEKLRKIIKNF